ncbi:MAG TPA: (Fe-S)-binding protein [Thermoplasmata archaeon]|nr:(Fe-S)-binding protein [Thermoplasmata archaeon]
MPPTDAKPLVWNDELWEELCRSTDTAACFQCGSCTATCPLAEGGALNIRQLIRLGAFGNGAPGLWACTTCAQCNVGCPRGVDVVEVVRHLRSRGWKHNDVPAGLRPLLWAEFQDGNPYRLPPSQRAGWMRGLSGREEGSHDGASTVLYVGCTASYDPRAQRTARALARILAAAEVPFRVLGDKEVCCGETPRALGVPGLFHELSTRNAEALQSAGATRVVTVSPHCFDALRAGLGDQVEVVHYSQLLDELLSGGKLKVNGGRTGTVTYHDPCYLGRQHGVYEPPRRLLESTGAKIVEMPRTRRWALCCGGGGGNMWRESDSQGRLADQRVAEAGDTGAKVLATACPFCITCFSGARTPGRDRMEIMDVAEIVARAVGVPA